MVFVPWVDPCDQNVHIQKECHAPLHPFLFPKLVDEVIGDHSTVACRPLQNRPAALIGAEPVPLRELRTRRLLLEQVSLQRFGEQCTQCSAALGRADLRSPVEGIRQIYGGLHSATLPYLQFDTNGAASGEAGASRPYTLTAPGEFPVVTGTAEIEIMVGRDDEYTDDMVDNRFTEWYEEKTGVRINWIQVSGEEGEEKANIVLASGQYPEAFMATGIAKTQLAVYGAQGVFVSLNDAIYEPFKHDDVLPSLFYSEQQARELAQVEAVLKDFIVQSMIQFITGDRSLDSDWESYLEELERIGIDQFVSINQAAYDAVYR